MATAPFSRVTSYFREARAELKKVIWPTRREATVNTILVIGVSVGFAIFFAVVDYALNIGFEKIVTK